MSIKVIKSILYTHPLMANYASPLSHLKNTKTRPLFTTPKACSRVVTNGLGAMNTYAYGYTTSGSGSIVSGGFLVWF